MLRKQIKLKSTGQTFRKRWNPCKPVVFVQSLTLYVEDVYVAGAYDSSGNELTTEEGVAQSFTVYVKAAEIESMNRAINYGEIHIYQK